MFLLIIVAFYTTRVVLQVLGVDDFGLYNVVAGFVALITFVNQSITNSIQRFLNFEMGKGIKSSINTYFGVSLLTQLLISGIILTLAETIGLWFINTKLNIPGGQYLAANVVYQTSVISVIIKIFQSPFNAIVIAKEKMQFYAVISLLEAFVQLGVVYILMVVTTKRLILYGILLLIVALLVFISNVVYVRHLLPELRIRLIYNKDYFYKLTSFCGWNLLGSCSGVIKSQGINVLLNIFFNVVVNAARGISFQVLSGITRFSSNFQVAMYPQIIQSYAQGNMERYFQLSYACSKISLYFMWILTLPVIVCTQYILKLWLGDNVPEYSVIFVQIVLLTGLIDSLASAIATQIYATGEIKRYQIEVSLIILSILPASWLLFKMGFPPTSALWCSLVLSILAQVSRVRIWCKLVNTNVRIYIKQIVLPGISIMVFSYSITYCLWSFSQHNFCLFLSTIIVSLISNVCLIYTCGLQSKEKALIRKLITSKISKKL